MTYCTCVKGSPGCYICNPDDFDKINGTIVRKVKAMAIGRDCKSSDGGQPKCIKEVDQQLVIMKENIDAIDKLTNDASQRLQRMSRQAMKSTDPEAESSGPQAPLANELFSFNNRLLNIIENMKDMINRLEIDS